MLQFNEIKEQAIGRWPGIFNAIGIDVGDGRHTACPVCGGKDRFRMDDKEGKGTFFCNQCGAGDGWKLLQYVLNCDFKEAIEQVAPLVGSIGINKPKEKKVNPEILRELFKKSIPAEWDNLAGQYLSRRGLKIISKKLRYIKECWNSDVRGNLPAMLAVVTMPDGKAATMHRTYLDLETAGKAKVDKPKKMMPPLQKITGGAIRLFEPVNGRIGIAEGIETAIACYEQSTIPTWSAISSTILESFEPPQGITKVTVFADNDKNFAGQKAAYTLANRLFVKYKLHEVNVEIPPNIGDWLDCLKNR